MLGLDLIAAHMVGDYILQSDEMARLKLTDSFVRFVHVTLYTIPMIIVALLHSTTPTSVLFFSMFVWISHFMTDSKRWASGDRWPPKPILVDQAIHLVTLAVASRLIY